MLKFLEDKKEDEFRNANILVNSEDEEQLMYTVQHTNEETQRFYNKYELQQNIKSDPAVTPSKD